MTALVSRERTGKHWTAVSDQYSVVALWATDQRETSGRCVCLWRRSSERCLTDCWSKINICVIQSNSSLSAVDRCRQVRLPSTKIHLWRGCATCHRQVTGLKPHHAGPPFCSRFRGDPEWLNGGFIPVLWCQRRISGISASSEMLFYSSVTILFLDEVILQAVSSQIWHNFMLIWQPLIGSMLISCLALDSHEQSCKFGFLKQSSTFSGTKWSQSQILRSGMSRTFLPYSSLFNDKALYRENI